MALKAAFAVDPGLHVSYVGVCGTPTDDDEKIGFAKNNKPAFEFLYDKNWLFFNDAPPGLSVVKLNEKMSVKILILTPGQMINLNSL